MSGDARAGSTEEEPFDADAFVRKYEHDGGGFLNPNKIPPKHWNEVFLKMLGRNNPDPAVYSIGRFSGLSKEVADKLIQMGEAKEFIMEEFLKRIDHFSGIDVDQTVLDLLKKGHARVLWRQDYHFGRRHAERILAAVVSEERETWMGLNHLKQQKALVDSPGFDRNLFVKEMVERGHAHLLDTTMESWKDLSLDTAMLLMRQYQALVGSHLGSFVGLNKEIALALIEDRNRVSKELSSGWLWSVATGIKNFPRTDHREIALALIENGGAGFVAMEIKNFSGIDREILLKLADRGIVVERYPEVNLQELVVRKLEALAKKRRPRGIERDDNYAEDIYRVTGFDAMDHGLICEKLIEAGYPESVLRHLPKLKGVDHKEIAMKLIREGFGNYVFQYELYPLDHLDGDVSKALMDAGWCRGLAYHYEKFAAQYPELRERLIAAGIPQWDIRTTSSFARERRK